MLPRYTYHIYPVPGIPETTRAINRYQRDTRAARARVSVHGLLVSVYSNHGCETSLSITKLFYTRIVPV